MLLNKITKIGTKLGNFTFIDTEKEDYFEAIIQSLTNSLEIALKSVSPFMVNLKDKQFANSEDIQIELNV